ncbi:MAG TPA: ADP-ribosyltransferase [Tepidisphaeraceae bacterium]|jgi:hypothetical protein
MPLPSPEQVTELFRIHKEFAEPERQRRASAFDDTRSWVGPDGYRLSDRVWQARDAVRSQIDQVLVHAIATGEDALKTAKILEQYLAPGEKNAVKTYWPGRAGAGSFSARRLARTEVTRAHGQATILAAQADPFTRGVKWTLSKRHPEHDQCDVNAETDVGLGPGIYPPERVPRYPNHPHDLCTLSPVTVEDDAAVVDELRQRYGLDEEPPAAPPPEPESVPPAAAQQSLERLERARFADDAAAQTWREETFPNWETRYSPEELDALGDYQAAGYRSINRALRRPEDVRQSIIDEELARLPAGPKTQRMAERAADRRMAEIRSTIETLDRAIDRTTLDRDIVGWRGLSARSFGPDPEKLVGTIIEDHGFVSTSLREDVGRKFYDFANEEGKDGALVEILLPRGAKIAPMDAIITKDFGSWEEEILLPRDSRFRVLSVGHTASGRRLIRMELVR